VLHRTSYEFACNSQDSLLHRFLQGHHQLIKGLAEFVNLNGLPKRSLLDVILPDSEYYSQLEKAEMAKAQPVNTIEDMISGDS